MASNPDIYPGAQYRPLASGEPSAMTQVDIICLHTMVGFLNGTDSMFKQGGWSGTESHFGIGGPYDKQGQDGLVYQWVPCDRRADCNLEGNWHIISIETSDGAKSPVPKWSDNQVDSIARIIAWGHTRYGVPLVLIPDTKPGRRGIGYHKQGIDPWRVSGGEKWSPSQGKICPGEARIAQIPQVIERAKQILGLVPPTQPPPTQPPPTQPPSTGTFTLSFEGSGAMTLRIVKKVSPNMTGTDIKSWQRLLADRGYSPGTIDGIWGNGSDTACKNFQKAKGLTADGIIGPGTGERLLEG